MSVPFSLLAKALGGVAAIAAPVATGVIYREEIKGLLIPKDSVAPSHEENGSKDSLDTKSKEESLKMIEDNTKISLTYKDDGTCSITVNESTNLQTVKNKLNELLGSSTLTENHKRHRRGLIKKCESNSKSFSITVPNVNEIDLSGLFELNEEKLNTTEETSLSSATFTINSSLDSSNKIITVSVTNSTSNSDPIIGSCKIIGTHETGVDEDLTSSKEDINDSIKNKIETDSNKTENIKKLFTKCKQSFNNEINLKLQAKTPTDGEVEKYEFKNLTDIFPGT